MPLQDQHNYEIADLKSAIKLIDYESLQDVSEREKKSSDYEERLAKVKSEYEKANKESIDAMNTWVRSQKRVNDIHIDSLKVDLNEKL